MRWKKCGCCDSSPSVHNHNVKFYTNMFFLQHNLILIVNSFNKPTWHEEVWLLGLKHRSLWPEHRTLTIKLQPNMHLCQFRAFFWEYLTTSTYYSFLVCSQSRVHFKGRFSRSSVFCSLYKKTGSFLKQKTVTFINLNLFDQPTLLNMYTLLVCLQKMLHFEVWFLD